MQVYQMNGTVIESKSCMITSSSNKLPTLQNWLEHWHQKEMEWDQTKSNATWGEYWKAKELEKKRFFAIAKI
jgi:hypothetical protein